MSHFASKELDAHANPYIISILKLGKISIQGGTRCEGHESE